MYCEWYQNDQDLDTADSCYFYSYRFQVHVNCTGMEQ